MDNENDMISITVLIAGRPYPLRINKADEPSIRTIVKEINNQVNNFQLKYTTKDKQDCLSMAALTYAVDLAKAKKNKTTAVAGFLKLMLCWILYCARVSSNFKFIHKY